MIKEKSKQYRAIKVKYLGPTNTKGSRIKLIDERFGQSKTIEYGPNGGDTLDQAHVFLASRGYNIVGHAEMANYSIILVDNSAYLQNLR
jgi:hypothetical protein